MANLGKSVKGKNKKKKVVAKTSEVSGKAKRLEESDYAKRMAALQRRLLREKLGKELQMSKWNLAKIQNTWRKIMRLAKVEELRMEIEIISQSHERNVDRKDAIIQMLDRDVEEAEEQYQLALRQHLCNIDRLIDIQDERLLALEEEFDKDLTILDKEFQDERRSITTTHSSEKHLALMVIETVAMEEQEKSSEAKTEHEQTTEICRSKNLECIHALQSSLDNQIETLERDFESAHLTYLTNTDQRTQEFKDLTQADQTLSADIDVKIRKIDAIQTSLQHMRTKMATNTREAGERNETLKKEKEGISAHFLALKAKVQRQSNVQKQRLAALATVARETSTTLKSKAALAESVLGLAERSRRLETDKEKVLFECLPAPSEEDIAAAIPSADKSLIDPSADWTRLDNFYTKYNKALLDKLTLEREKERKTRENAELQSILRQYLEGISVTETAVSKPNTLLMINGETSLAAPMPVRMAPPAVMDANHMVGTGRAGGPLRK